MLVRHCLNTLWVVAAGLTLTLAGCQQDGAGGAITPTPGFGLHFVDEGETAKLAYGQANSDNVGLMLECEKGSGQVAVTDIMRKGAAKRISLISGSHRADLGAEIQSIDGASLLSAVARTDAPALAAFRDTGELRVASGSVRYGVSASPQEKTSVKRFFAACDRA